MSEIWDRPAALEQMLSMAGREKTKLPVTVEPQLGRISVVLAIVAGVAFVPLAWLGGNKDQESFFLPALVAYASIPAAGFVLALAATRQREDAVVGLALNIFGLLGVPVFFVVMIGIALRDFKVAG